MKTTNSYSSYKKNLKRAIIKNTISNVKSEIPEAFTAVPVLVFALFFALLKFALFVDDAKLSVILSAIIAFIICATLFSGFLYYLSHRKLNKEYAIDIVEKIYFFNPLVVMKAEHYEEITNKKYAMVAKLKHEMDCMSKLSHYSITKSLLKVADVL